jgi:hypothetical protein
MNYKKMLQYYHDKEWTTGSDDGSDFLGRAAYDLLTVRKFQKVILPQGTETNYSYLKEAIKFVDDLSSTYSKRGYLEDAPDPNYQISNESTESIKARRLEIASRLENVNNLLERFHNLVDTYRIKLVFKSRFDSHLTSIFAVIDEKGKFRSDLNKEVLDDFDFDPDFINAINEQVTELIEEHKKKGHLPRSTKDWEDERKRIDALKNKPEVAITFNGFSPPEGKKAVISPEEIIEDMRINLPPDFINPVVSINYKDIPADLDIDDPTWETIGRMNPVFEDKDMVAADIDIYSGLRIFVSQETNEKIVNSHKEEALDTLHHEIGHTVHNLLTYDELDAWDKAMSEDTINVTDYVKFAGKDSEERKKREDFCESLKMYLSDPALLEVRSPHREFFMKRLFYNRLRSDQIESFFARIDSLKVIRRADWQARGLSDEEVKARYQYLDND